MSLIRTILGGLLLLLAFAFVFWLVYSNGQPETVRLSGLMGDGIPNPFAGQGDEKIINLPLGMWFIFFTIFGIFLGLFSGWFMAGATRVRARQNGRKARLTEKELKAAKQKADEAKSEIDGLKTEKKDLEVKVKRADSVAIAAPSEVKKLSA